ncbi:MAG: F0F1 ATP synthase subunit B' [Pseudomonadota bacterium]
MATETGQSAGGMPQLEIATFPNQIFWLLVALIAIYFLMSRIALPRIANVLAERQGAIQRDLDAAEDMKHKAVEAEEAYNKALADARVQAAEIMAETKAEIQAELDKATEIADAEIAAKAAESEKAIAAIRDSAVKSVQEVAVKTTTDIVKTVGSGSGDAKAIKAAVTARMKG